MRLDNEQQSSNIEDRRGGKGGRGGGFGGGLPFGGRGIGIGGLIIIGLILFILPANIRDSLLGQLTGAMGGGSSLVQPGGETAEPASNTCPEGDAPCVFVARVLNTTERVWTQKFAERAVPGATGPYQAPVLVLFDGNVSTACGSASSDVGPFYCPGDNKLYIDLTFYDVMARRLNAPGDFAQAYVIAHEVGHHIQFLTGATRQVDAARGGPRANEMSVRLELQADCFAGVWGHDTNEGGQLDPGDLEEALNAAHQIGDDTLQTQSKGYAQPSTFTHGTSAQRMKWFRQGFTSGDPRTCDTFTPPAANL
ncbi:MAG: neutral zinc metallopeptidase [Hyphomonadaceae bacterium]|nr:neutral zinc metallopeptidase [Hyphomonadaceae bacterium]